MKSGNAIEVNHITKSFKVYLDKGSTIKEKVLFRNRRRYEERQVLKDISFEVKKGEAIGLIGHNGCGKSTTLKLLTRIMYPDSGTIEMAGRVSSLIELGAGFHPDMSGRENIYINASIFGLSKKEIDRRLDDIIAFSELEDYIDNPVRTYSSGMYMRLAFSVAINVDADILLIDEILAVGDVAFQAKCFNRLREIKKAGTTIVIVSHSLSQIEQICERSIWIHDGEIREEGAPRIVDPKYMAYMSRKESERKKKLAAKKLEEQKLEEEDKPKEPAEKKELDEITSEKPEQKEANKPANTEETKKDEVLEEKQPEDEKRWGSREVYMKNVTVLDKDGTECTDFQNDEPFIIRIEYKAEKRLDDVVFGIAIYRSDQVYIYGSNTLIDYSSSNVLEGEGYIDLKIERMPVNAGTYTIDLAFHRPDGFNYDFWRESCEVNIQNVRNEVGVISLPHEWEVK